MGKGVGKGGRVCRYERTGGKVLSSIKNRCAVGGPAIRPRHTRRSAAQRSIVLRGAARSPHPVAPSLKPGVRALLLERQHAEHALVYAPQWLPIHEALKGFDAESELLRGEAALGL